MTRFLVNTSLQTKVLIFFLPIIIFSVLLTGLFSYLSAVSQLKKNTYALLEDTLQQTNVLLNDKLWTVLDQLITIENTDAYKNFVAEGVQNSLQQPGYNDVIQINKTFEDIYVKNFQMLDSLYFRLSSGREFSLQKDDVPIHVGIPLDAWVEKFSDNKQPYHWLISHKDEVIETTKDRLVFSSFKVIGNPDSPMRGILLLNLRVEYFLNLLKNVVVSPNGYLMLIAPDGVVYSKDFDPKYSVSEYGIEYLKSNSGNYGSFNIRSRSGEPMFAVFNTLSANRWVLAAIVPETDIMQKAGQIKYISLAIIVLLVFIASATAALFAKSISNPIRLLSRQVRRFEQGDYNVQFEIKEKNEFGILARGLSSLLGTVTSLLKQLQEEQEKKRQMELLALQSQITPHFLYNTLASIKHLVDMKDTDRASKMVSALTKFYMLGISKGKELITVREELDHIHNYLLIQNMRYSKDFDFELEINPEVLNCLIPKLTLQPIVENSIYHGIKSKPGKGVIRIAGWRKGSTAVLEVFDDGLGIAPDKLQQLNRSIRDAEVEKQPITYGLRNAHQRIVLYFGAPYGLTIESREEEYTSIQVAIPWTHNEENG